jgi:hypothetical protein
VGITIRRYQAEDCDIWDRFVRGSKNATFLFERGFMDYHADRFQDHSLIAEDAGQVIALLPANITDRTLHSHQGLSYGGWLTDASMTASAMLAVSQAAVAFLADNNVDELIYKCIPSIYHSLPADEDVYAVFRLGGTLFRRDLATVIDLSAAPLAYSSQRKRNISKAVKSGLRVVQSTDVEAFHQLLSDVLKEKHGASPVHSADELRLLMERFPSNIRLFLCLDDADLCAATLVFETDTVAHTQYLASSARGRTCGALDYLLSFLISDVFANKKYFSFGISTEEGGRYLNEGLVSQKEGFGGRSVVHDFYRIPCAGNPAASGEGA